MPGEDLKIGNDGDYIDDGNGGFELTATAQPSLRHQMLDVLGEVIFDPESGRRQETGGTLQNTADTLTDQSDSVREALGPLVQDGLIDNIELLTDRDQAGRQGLEVRSRDTQSGGQLFISPFFTEFGG